MKKKREKVGDDDGFSIEGVMGDERLEIWNGGERIVIDASSLSPLSLCMLKFFFYYYYPIKIKTKRSGNTTTAVIF